MITTSLFLHFIFSISILFPSINALNQDGTTLLSFKQYLISYPPSLFQTWNHTQPTPCSWSGVTCAPQTGSVISLVLPNSRLIGSIPNDITRLEHLRVLDLSNNSINGTLPISLFNISNLQTLALSYNFISGGLPEMFNTFHNLRVLNLSHNYLSGRVSGGFDTIEVLDLSYNMFDKNLPLDFGGFFLNYLNLSHNKIPGSISPEFASQIPERAIVDLSFNNFTGQIPQTMLSNAKAEYFAGNLDMCGKPLNKMCTVPSSHSLPPNVSIEYPSTAAIAAIPKTAGKSKNRGDGKVDTGKIVAIVLGDAVAVVLFVVLVFYAYQIRKKKMNQNTKEILPIKIGESTSTYSPVRYGCCCFIDGMEEETSETSTEYESVGNNDNDNDSNNNKCLVMVDGETELEMETLLKASAYILGSSGGSIVYKAVVRSGGGDGGAAFAVRRIAKCGGVEKMREFEKIVRVLGKVRHPNLVKVRGFYWGEEEKLLICDYVSGGSLAGGGGAAAAAYKKASSSSCHLSFEVRLKIAKGIAKGLSYIHEKKHVHGNIKPSNILLTSEMDALISDFGLEWLVSGQKTCITDKSTRNFGSKRATSSIEETLIHRNHQNSSNNNTYVAPSTSLHKCTSPYQAPESMKTLKPNPKWDVYSFGVVLLELFSGKMLSTKELAHWNTDLSISNNETKILEIINGFATIDVPEQKDCLLMCFKLGFNCASLAPQKRPSMKEALLVLEKISCPS